MPSDVLQEFYEGFLPSETVVLCILLKPPSFVVTTLKGHSVPREPRSRSIAAGAELPRPADPNDIVGNGPAATYSGPALRSSPRLRKAQLILTEKGVRAIRDTVLLSTTQLFRQLTK